MGSGGQAVKCCDLHGVKLRETGEKDVAFKVWFCGICQSDLHMVKTEWRVTTYPLVPGHKIVGVVTEVGNRVQKYKVGDEVGFGGLVGSCQSRENCASNLENCSPKIKLTYGAKYIDGTTTYGGYSDIMVVDEHFVNPNSGQPTQTRKKKLWGLR